jgi:hypothetical protein
MLSYILHPIHVCNNAYEGSRIGGTPIFPQSIFYYDKATTRSAKGFSAELTRTSDKICIKVGAIIGGCHLPIVKDNSSKILNTNQRVILIR